MYYHEMCILKVLKYLILSLDISLIFGIWERLGVLFLFFFQENLKIKNVLDEKVRLNVTHKLTLYFLNKTFDFLVNRCRDKNEYVIKLLLA